MPKKPSKSHQELTREAKDTTGVGGELHQIAGGSHPPLTTQTGAIVADDENSLRGGQRGPTLLEDSVLLEKIQHFDHERIPEESCMRAVSVRTATRISGLASRYLRDFWNAINEGSFPEWELGLQLFDDEFANNFDFDVLDAKKSFPKRFFY